VANIANKNAYWHSVREDLMTNTGVSTFFTFSSADMHWPELHDLFGGKCRNITSEERWHSMPLV